MFKVFTLSVPCRCGAEAECTQCITDTGFENTVFNLLHITGENPFIVKGIAGYIFCAECSLMHGDEVTPNTLANVFSAECPVFHKHIHLHTMAESFVCYQPGDFRGRNNFIFARLYRAGIQQLKCRCDGLLCFCLQLREKLRTAKAGNALIPCLCSSVTAGKGNHCTFGIDVTLRKISVFRQKQLTDMS